MGEPGQDQGLTVEVLLSSLIIHQTVLGKFCCGGNHLLLFKLDVLQLSDELPTSNHDNML